MIAEIYMMPNGLIIHLDEKGEVMPDKAVNVFVTHLKALQQTNLVDSNTVVHANHTTKPVSFWTEQENDNAKT